MDRGEDRGEASHFLQEEAEQLSLWQSNFLRLSASAFYRRNLQSAEASIPYVCLYKFFNISHAPLKTIIRSIVSIFLALVFVLLLVYGDDRLTATWDLVRC